MLLVCLCVVSYCTVAWALFPLMAFMCMCIFVEVRMYVAASTKYFVQHLGIGFYVHDTCNYNTFFNLSKHCSRSIFERY